MSKLTKLYSLLVLVTCIMTGSMFASDGGVEESQQICAEKIADMGDVFMIGERSFCDICPPAGLTREVWYKQKLEEQETYLRYKISAMLHITPEEYAQCEELAKEDIRGQEAFLESVDLRGRWIADYEQRKIIRYPDGPDGDTVFCITDEDIDGVISLLRQYGYTGKIIFSDELDGEEETAAIAHHDAIQIFPLFFLCDSWENRLFLLRHELSHIFHGDRLFELTIKQYVKRNFLKLKDEECYPDEEALLSKGLTLDVLEKAQDLLMQTWFGYHECRADMEAFLAIKDHDIFKSSIAGQDQYRGFPFCPEIRSAYQNRSAVPFVQDFCKGIENDYKRSLEKK